MSISNVTGEGLLDNNTLDKYTLTFRNTTSFLNDKMTLDAGLTYVDQKDKNMLGSGRYFNPLLALYTYPRGESVEELRLYETYNSATGISQQNWKWGAWRT